MNDKSSEFERALSEQWERVAPVIRRHYGLSGGMHISMGGTMDRVGYRGLGRALAPFMRLLGALVPYGGRDVPIRVENWTQPGRDGLFWRRRFFFPGKPEVQFRSRMECDGPDRIVEYLGLGLGVRLAVRVREDGGLHMADRGYVLRLPGIKLPLPLHWIAGRAEIEEWPTGDASFAMRFDIIHPLFGPTFHYSGRFTLE